MNVFKKSIIRSFLVVSRLYFRIMPIPKGKAALWDSVKWVFARAPGAMDTRITRTRQGHRMRVRFEEGNERDLYFWGTWTPGIEWLMRRTLRKSDVFVDVGANVGYFTLFGSKLVGQEGHVFAIEASPTTHRICQSNIDLNGCNNVTLYQCAASNQSGATTLYPPDNECDLASLRPNVRGKYSSGLVTHHLKAVRVDELLGDEIKKRIRLIKIDVEGADYLTLQGMHQILDAPESPDVICEVNDGFLREMGASETDLIDYMLKLGYRAYLLYSCRARSFKEASFQARVRRYRPDNYQLIEMHTALKSMPQRPAYYDVYFTRRKVD